MRHIRLSAIVTSFFAAAAFLLVSMPAASAQQSAISGSWRGNGVVNLTTGEKEKVRCRATFKPWSKSTVRMNAVCATAAARVSQTAFLKRRGSRNRYAGTFHNPEYGVSGQIRVTIRGRRMSAALSSDVANATLHLRR